MRNRFQPRSAIAKLSLAACLVAAARPGALQADDAKRVPPGTVMHAIVSKVDPVYPAIAKQVHVAGDVNLDVTISEEGAVEEVKVLQGNPLLASPATDAVKKWKFSPIKLDGKAIRAIGTVVIKFSL